MPHSVTDLPPVSSSKIDLQAATVVGDAKLKFPVYKAHGTPLFSTPLFTYIFLVIRDPGLYGVYVCK